MMKLTTVSESDRELIQSFIDADTLSRPSTPDFWFTRDDALLSFAVEDNLGVVLFARFDQPVDGQVRFHTLFMPEDGTSRKRVAIVLIKGFQSVIDKIKESCSSVIFESISADLTHFMVGHFSFVPVDGTKDYVLYFGAQQ
jgi:hypothetical protein